MKALVSAAGAAAIDTSARQHGALSEDQLMEAAAAALYRAIKALPGWPGIGPGPSAGNGPGANGRITGSGHPGGQVHGGLVAICGSGNNAGDALAVLRLAGGDGIKPLTAIVPDKLKPVPAQRCDEARRAGVRIVRHDDPAVPALVHGAAMLLDGLTGTGLSGSLRGSALSLATMARHCAGPVVAIDVPSGLRCGASMDEAMIVADQTLCIAPLKLELFTPALRQRAGSIVVVDGVFPRHAADGSQMQLLEPGDLAAYMPMLAADAHKGRRGALAIHAGAVGTTGAAILAARAGAAAGAGTVTLFSDEQCWPVLATALQAQMVKPVSAANDRSFAAVLAGPGWGLDRSRIRLLDGLLTSATPLVLDADAIRLLALGSETAAAAVNRPGGCPLILTPHPGEFTPLAARALGLDVADPAGLADLARAAVLDPLPTLGAVARYYHAVVILKNAVTWLAAPDGRIAVWDGLEPALGTGGSGDVLAGLVAGYLARQAPAFDAAVAAVIVHGLAGREAAADFGFFDAAALLAPAARLSYRASRRADGRQCPAADGLDQNLPWEP
jgi:NAD(P)H-hydrate epimerase